MKLVAASRVWSRHSLLVLLLFVAMHGPELGASPPIYRITDIGSLGGDLTAATAINSSGHVVGNGRVSIEDQTPRAFYWDGVTIADMGTLGGPSAIAIDINDAGIAIGSSSTGGGPDPDTHAFLWDGEFMEDLGTLGGRHSSAADINNSGQVAGSSLITGNSAAHAFLWDGTAMVDLGTFGGLHSWPTAINESGWITGSALHSSGHSSAFLYDGVTMHDLGSLLSGTYSAGVAINSSGQVTGTFQPFGDGFQHAFLWDGTLMRELGTLGMDHSISTAINDAGQVTGRVIQDEDPFTPFAERAFLWDGTQMLDLGSLAGGTLSGGTDIDSQGRVIGSAFAPGQRAFLWQDGQMFDLNKLVDPGDPLVPFVTLEIPDKFGVQGHILVRGFDSRFGNRSYLLTPLSNPHEVSTLVGVDVSIEPLLILPGSTSVSTVQITYSSVDTAGTTSVTAASTPSGGVSESPSGFAVGNPPVYFDVATTATISGPVTLCFSWEESQFQDEETIGVFHFEDGAWRNVTTSLDTQENKVCGATLTLSPFALFEAAGYQFAGFYQPLDNPPTRNIVKAGAAIPVKFALGGDFGLGILAAGYPQSQQVTCDSGAPSDPVSETVTAGSSGLTYDSATGQYVYVWKTNKSWASQCRRLILQLSDGFEAVAEFGFTK